MLLIGGDDLVALAEPEAGDHAPEAVGRRGGQRDLLDGRADEPRVGAAQPVLELEPALEVRRTRPSSSCPASSRGASAAAAGSGPSVPLLRYATPRARGTARAGLRRPWRGRLGIA